jgi:tRNA modification GTPase
MRERVRDSLIATGDTIVAVATAPGRAGIGVVRVSGPEAVALVSRFFRSPAPRTPRRACSGRFVLPGGEGLDHVVATFFKGPASYTGEDLVEVSAHGNPLILNEIVAAMCGAGARRARRGEFTGRAVANGKLDLAQAEAVRDFIEAETLAQARSALGQLEGAMSGRLRPVRESLLALVAELEAGIDFPDDAPGGEAVAGPLAARLGACARPLEVLAASFVYGRLLTGGILVSFLGRPNTG